MSFSICLSEKSNSLIQTTNQIHSYSENSKLKYNLAKVENSSFQQLILPVESVIKIASKNIESLIFKNKYSNTYADKTRCPFYTTIKPQASVYEFIITLASLTKLQASTIILAIKYIDRYCDMNYYHLSYLNVYKLILISTIVSLKFNEDQIVRLDRFSKFSKLSIDELIILEKHFLEGIKFKLYVCCKSYSLIECYIAEKLKCTLIQ